MRTDIKVDPTKVKIMIAHTMLRLGLKYQLPALRPAMNDNRP